MYAKGARQKGRFAKLTQARQETMDDDKRYGSLEHTLLHGELVVLFFVCHDDGMRFGRGSNVFLKMFAKKKRHSVLAHASNDTRSNDGMGLSGETLMCLSIFEKQTADDVPCQVLHYWVTL